MGLYENWKFMAFLTFAQGACSAAEFAFWKQSGEVVWLAFAIVFAIATLAEGTYTTMLILNEKKGGAK